VHSTRETSQQTDVLFASDRDTSGELLFSLNKRLKWTSATWELSRKGFLSAQAYQALVPGCDSWTARTVVSGNVVHPKGTPGSCFGFVAAQRRLRAFTSPGAFTNS